MKSSRSLWTTAGTRGGGAAAAPSPATVTAAAATSAAAYLRTELPLAGVDRLYQTLRRAGKFVLSRMICAQHRFGGERRGPSTPAGLRTYKQWTQSPLQVIPGPGYAGSLQIVQN